MTGLAPAKSAVDRFADPLYSLAEASRFLGLPESTFRSWARGHDVHVRGRHVTADPVITDLGTPGQRGASVPFVGLAEGYALAAMRSAGVPVRRVRPALEQLNWEEMGIGHAPSSKRLYTDGAEVLYDYAQRHDGKVVENHLKRITFGTDGYAIAIPLPD